MTIEKPVYSGIVDSACGNGFFKVNVHFSDNDKEVIVCQLSGKMRTKNIKVVGGDRVEVEMDPYDLRKGRITFRNR
jgi:translation initiation factor IF-1